ncbi:MAG: hypothetical protein L0L10_03060 [Tetragenococcus sp.]|nr:hypothetical protein [Tetragenococcus sp.]
MSSNIMFKDLTFPVTIVIHWQHSSLTNDFELLVVDGRSCQGFNKLHFNYSKSVTISILKSLYRID